MTMKTTMDTTTTGDSNGGSCPRLFQSTECINTVMGDATYNQRHQNTARGDKNKTINHGCGGGNYDSGGNSGGNSGASRGRESNAGIGGGRSSSLLMVAATGLARTKEMMKTVTAVVKATVGASTAIMTAMTETMKAAASAMAKAGRQWQLQWRQKQQHHNSVRNSGNWVGGDGGGKSDNDDKQRR